VVTFAGLDWVVFGLFVGLIFALGFSVKLREASALQFLAAGRALSLPLFVATLVATWYGGILGIAESVKYFGLGTILLMGVPYYVFALVYALVYAKRVREADQISIPERLFLRYGKWPAILGAGLVFLLGVPAPHVLMIGDLLQALTHFPEGTRFVKEACVIGGTLIGTLFLYKGGLLADARASTIAFVMMYVGFAVIVFSCLAQFPPMATWGVLENKDLLRFDGGQAWPAIVSFFILGAWTLIDPGFHQRVASAKTPETGQRGIFVAILFWMVFDILTVSTGMYAISLLPQIAPGAMPALEANPRLFFPALGQAVLPPGLKAVFFCGMFGTILSAMVGYSLVSGASFGRELVCRLKPGLDETKWSRIGIGVASVTAIALALKIDSVVALWYSWGGCVIGAILVPVTLSYGIGRWRLQPVVIAASMAAGFLASFGWLIYTLNNGNLYQEITLTFGYTQTKFSLGTLLPSLLVSLIVLGIGSLIARTPHDERRADGRAAS
jgi:SSS family solute:Na+ symporter